MKESAKFIGKVALGVILASVVIQGYKTYIAPKLAPKAKA